jgi:hypothetical protein
MAAENYGYYMAKQLKTTATFWQFKTMTALPQLKTTATLWQLQTLATLWRSSLKLWLRYGMVA